MEDVKEETINKGTMRIFTPREGYSSGYKLQHISEYMCLLTWDFLEHRVAHELLETFCIEARSVN